MEYYQYFRLKGPPFQPASPDGAVYFSPTHLEGLATLESGLSGELTGLTMLTGEAGTGKTTLIYSLLQRDFKRLRVAHIEDPKLSFAEIMQVILRQMNLYSTGTTKLEYLEALDRLLKQRGGDERIAIIVDESQLLSDDVLEELRLLSNRGDRSLQLILVGHPELAERLKRPELRQLNQRISSRGVLKPLTAAQAVQYVECKLSAQGSSCAAIFERGALKRLLQRSDGIPRKINMLCHSAMQAAYNGAENKVSYKTANKIAAEYYDSVKVARRGFFARPLLVPAVGGALAAVLLLGLVYPNLRPNLRLNLWPGWVRDRIAASGVTTEQQASPVKPVEEAKTVDKTIDKTIDQTVAVEPVKSAEQAKPVEQAKPPEQVKPGQAKAAESSGVEGAKPPTAPPAPSPLEARASEAPAATAPIAPKSGVAEAATEPEKNPGRTGPTGLTASAATTATQPQAEAPADGRPRSQITVKEGDTLEKIAVRYLGSASGINALIKANPQLTNINQLLVGQLIYLPPGVGPKAMHDEAASAPPDADAVDSPSVQGSSNTEGSPNTEDSPNTEGSPNAQDFQRAK